MKNLASARIWVLGLDFGVEGDDAGVGVEVDGADTADRHAGHEDDGVSLETVDVFRLEVQQGGLGEGVNALGEVDDKCGQPVTSEMARNRPTFHSFFAFMV